MVIEHSHVKSIKQAEEATVATCEKIEYQSSAHESLLSMFAIDRKEHALKLSSFRC